MRAFGLLLADLAHRVRLPPPPPPAGLLARLGALFASAQVDGAGPVTSHVRGFMSNSNGGGDGCACAAPNEHANVAPGDLGAGGGGSGGGSAVALPNGNAGDCARGAAAEGRLDVVEVQRSLAAIAMDCTQTAVKARPSFTAICAELDRLFALHPDNASCTSQASVSC